MRVIVKNVLKEIDETGFRELFAERNTPIPADSKVVKITPKNTLIENGAIAFNLSRDSAVALIKRRKITVGLFLSTIEKFLLQCFNCFELGHTSRFCTKKSPCCGKCGEEGHLLKD